MRRAIAQERSYPQDSTSYPEVPQAMPSSVARSRRLDTTAQFRHDQRAQGLRIEPLAGSIGGHHEADVVLGNRSSIPTRSLTAQTHHPWHAGGMRGKPAFLLVSCPSGLSQELQGGGMGLAEA